MPLNSSLVNCILAAPNFRVFLDASPVQAGLLFFRHSATECPSLCSSVSCWVQADTGLTVMWPNDGKPRHAQVGVQMGPEQVPVWLSPEGSMEQFPELAETHLFAPEEPLLESMQLW